MIKITYNNYLLITLINIFFLILPKISFSQNQSDSIYKQAVVLLEDINEKYPCNLNIQWLYAQSLYWSKKFNKSMTVYEDVIANHPENYDLLLDYGVKLVDIGEFEKALPLLEKYLAYDKLGYHAMIALAKMYYWKGNYIKALNETDKILSIQPENSKAKELREEIIMTKSPWFKISSGITRDDQPLFSIHPSIEFGFSKNAFINPLLTVASPFFISEGVRYQAKDFRLSNKINIIKPKASVFIEGGLFMLPAKEEFPQAGLKIAKTLLRYFDLELLAEHKPYLNTKANMTHPMKVLNYDVSLNWSGESGWMGRLGHNIKDFYTESNRVYSSSLWVTSSPIRIGKTETRFGYAYSHSDSDEDRFIPEKTIEEIIEEQDFYSQVTGIYKPYFTPKDQSVNSIILLLKYKHAQKFEFGVKSVYGFFATTQNPYFFIDRKGNNLFIRKEYYKDNFNPYEERIFFNWHIISNKISIRSEYTLLSTYFYKSHSGLISLKVII